MKPEDLKPEDRDRLRELATLKVLWELLAAAKKNLDIVTWRREGFPEAEDFLHALESGGLHPLLEKWQELRRTIAANRPVPVPLDSNARRLTVLLVNPHLFIYPPVNHAVTRSPHGSQPSHPATLASMNCTKIVGSLYVEVQATIFNCGPIAP